MFDITSPDLNQAILDNPFDDLPRLVLADWLEDNDRPLNAAFIRGQVAPTLDYFPSPPDPYNVAAWLPNRWAGWLSQARVFTLSEQAFIYLNDYHIVLRRGFVDEVCCTIMDWVGGLCPLCAGSCVESYEVLRSERYGTSIRSRPCHYCEGRGEIEGVAKLFCQHWPLTKVSFIGIQPTAVQRMIPAEPGMWRLPRDHGIPTELMALIASPHHLFNEFPTKEGAVEALSRAAITYGRRLAGLKDLWPMWPSFKLEA